MLCFVLTSLKSLSVLESSTLYFVQGKKMLSMPFPWKGWTWSTSWIGAGEEGKQHSLPPGSCLFDAELVLSVVISRFGKDQNVLESLWRLKYVDWIFFSYRHKRLANSSAGCQKEPASAFLMVMKHTGIFHGLYTSWYLYDACHIKDKNNRHT